MIEASAAFQILKQKVTDISGLQPLDYAAALSGKALIYLLLMPANMVPALGSDKDQLQKMHIPWHMILMESPAEQNYPTHEKELLTVVHTLKLWRPLLLDVPVHIQTNHFMLKWFLQQRDLSE